MGTLEHHAIGKQHGGAQQSDPQASTSQAIHHSQNLKKETEVATIGSLQVLIQHKVTI